MLSSFIMTHIETMILVIKSRRVKLSRNMATKWGITYIYSTFMGKPERKGPLGIPRNRWDFNIHKKDEVMPLLTRCGPEGG